MYSSKNLAYLGDAYWSLIVREALLKEGLSDSKKLQNETIKYTTDPVVSSDIIGITEGALVDGLLTNVLESEGKQLVKIVAWYDNEMSYSAQMVRTAKKLANV